MWEAHPTPSPARRFENVWSAFQGAFVRRRLRRLTVSALSGLPTCSACPPCLISILAFPSGLTGLWTENIW